MKSGLIAKIARQCSLDYTTALKGIKGNPSLFKQWGKVAAAKEMFFNAEAHWWQSQQDNDDGEYGHEVSRVRECLRLLQGCSVELDIAKVSHRDVIMMILPSMARCG